MLFVSIINIGTVLGEDQYDCSNTLAVSHTAVCIYDADGNITVRGIVYIKNTGTAPAYVLGIDQLVQSEHSPHWITIKEIGLFVAADIGAAIIIQPDEYSKYIFNTTFEPEAGSDSYRNRMELIVLDPEGTSTKYVSEVEFALPEGTPPTTQPPTTQPPTTQPPTTQPPTTQPPTTQPPTTQPPTTQPPTTQPPTTQPPTTQPPTTQPPTTEPPIDVGTGTITNIEADICHGGTAVCVELTVTSGNFTQSSLHLVVTSQDEDRWDKVYEDCIDIAIGGDGLTSDNTPVTFCFDELFLDGDVSSYDVCVTWMQGLSCKRNAPVISRQCTGCRSIPTLDYLTYGAIISTLLLIGALYLRKISKER